MKNKTAGNILGLLELLALFHAYRLWLAPYVTETTTGFTQNVQYLTGLVSLILLLLPIIAIILIYKNFRSGFIFLACFPLCCIFFGITAIPIVSIFYGDSAKFNSLLTAFSNAIVCATAIWFYVSAHTNFKKEPYRKLSK